MQATKALLLSNMLSSTESIENAEIATFDAPCVCTPDISVELEPIQDLHGYDYPWPAGGGKNLIDMYGKVGTNFISKNVTLANGTYTLSATGINGNYATYVRTATTEGDISGEIIASKANQGNFTFTLAESSDVVIQWYCPNDTATTLSGHTFQLEKGSTATTYAPYSNICPISGRSEVNVYLEESYDPQATTKATIQLGQTVYGATVNVTEGKLTIDRAIADLTTGLSGGSVGSNYVWYKQLENALTVPNSQIANIKSEAYIPIRYNAIASSVNYIALRDNGNIYVNTGSQSVLPVGNVVYALATPVEVTLTPQQIQTLVGENNVWSDSGNISVRNITCNADFLDLFLKTKLIGEC